MSAPTGGLLLVRTVLSEQQQPTGARMKFGAMCARLVDRGVVLRLDPGASVWRAVISSRTNAWQAVSGEHFDSATAVERALEKWDIVTRETP